ncbi:tetratricopeptide repeat protein [Caulobacter soli]|uniref:tetratricopeptide repeat protein n=1 Tax=Caulobacter soli TaxID=2708539 RepID=UPI0013EE0C43|nr:tetratricopeptide repeat protein [Caulobacter soli]
MQDLIAARFQEGLAHHQADRFAEAQAAYGEVLTANPGHAEAWRLMSLLAEQFGRSDLARDWADKARALEPGEVHHLFGEGVALQQLGRFAEAETRYRRVLALAPEALEANNNLGLVLGRQGRNAEALAFFQRAIELSPGSPVFHNNLGIALTDLDRHAEAEACYRTATTLDPTHVGARHNLGKSLHALGRLEEAGQALQEALRLRQDDPRILNDMGVLLNQLGRVADAEMVYRTGLSLAPEDASLHYNLGLVLLKVGQYREGWAQYHWRWKTEDRPDNRVFIQPEWDGSPLPGGKLLITAEQGLGDILQFCRLAPLAAARLAPDARLILEAHKPLISLLRDQWPGIEVVGYGDPLPDFDAHLPLLSLGGVLEQDDQTIDGAPYLRPDPDRAAAWAERLAPLEGLKVGLVWSGGRRPWQPRVDAVDKRRSVRLAQLAPLASVPGVSFVSLQKDEPGLEARDPPPGMVLHDFTSDLTDFVETAALVANLDLVISVDTAVAHLAGAIGTPVWMLNRFDTCWRWELEREDTPWYAGLRQFRQPTAGDWPPVVEAMTTALAERTQD